nr:ShlB/FhaC/HecB family hemolysin secretion/activation protein [Neisseria basseii]
MSDALPVPEEAFGEGTSRMKIWTIGADVNIPFQTGKQLFAYDTNFQAQWSKTPLTPQDKIAIGRRYTCADLTAN